MQSLHIQVFYGENQYVAEGIEAAIVTQAPTLDELMYNIQEAVDLYFDDAPELRPDVRIEMNLAELMHG